MTSVAEFIEQLNRKRNELEESRGIVSPSLLKVLESEISEMEEALATSFSPNVLDGIAVSAKSLNSDIHAAADYRAHLIGVMAKRAVASCG